MQEELNATDAPLTFAEFQTVLEKLGPFGPSPQIAVAVSGGPDSLALCLLAHQWCQACRGSLTALIVDHGLRLESTQEAEKVAGWLTKRLIPHVILRWEGQKPSTRLQETARQARYRLLENWCHQNKIPTLLLGHQAEDQLETFLMRLARGSGPYGLSGMSARVQKPFVCLVRPLLKIPKKRLQSYLITQQQEWIQDPSNDRLDFERVRWRQRLFTLPQRGACEALMTQTQNYRQLSDRLFNAVVAPQVTLSPLGYAQLPLESFHLLPPPLQTDLLRRLIEVLGHQYYPQPAHKIQSLWQHLQRRAFTPRTCGGLRFSHRQGNVLVTREFDQITPYQIPPVPSKSYDFDAFVRVHLTTDDSGMTLKQLGPQGWAQLVQLYPELKRIDIPAIALYSTPALWRGDRIDPQKNLVCQYIAATNPSQPLRKFDFLPREPFSRFIFSKT